MPITFFNEKSGEVVTLSREPQVTAFINSSEMSINASQGQNMGWKLDVADKLRIEEMRQDPTIVQRLASERGIAAEDLRTQHFIGEILRSDAMAEKMRLSQINENPVHAAEYEARLRAAREAKSAPKAKKIEVVAKDEPVIVPVKTQAPKKATAKK